MAGGSDILEVRADNALIGKRAQECSNHRMHITSCESRYATAGDYGEPTKIIYTFRCSGSCGLVATLTVKN